MMSGQSWLRVALAAAVGLGLAGCYYAPPPPPPAYAYAPSYAYAPAYYPGYYYGPPVYGSIVVRGHFH